MTQRAAIYARLSKYERIESLDIQVEACKNFLEVQGFELAGIFKDTTSGTVAFTDRPEGAKLQELITRKAVDAVVVYRTNRLSYDSLTDLLENWKKSGVEIFSMDIGQ